MQLLLIDMVRDQSGSWLKLEARAILSTADLKAVTNRNIWW